MNFKIKGWGGVALLSAAMLGGGAWYMRSAAPKQDASKAAPPTSVAAVAAPVFEIPASDTLLATEQRLVQNLPISGNLKAINTVVIKSRVAGEITQLSLREGDYVKAGQVVARIDPTEYQRKLRQAEQQADAARAQVDIAKRQYDNNKSLVDKGFISVTALETSFSNLSGAEATYKAALSGADVARKVLEEAVLTSPISGQVSARLAQPGERVSVDVRLLEVVDLNSLELEATMSPADSIDVRVGQQATLQLEGREQAVTAKVQRIVRPRPTRSRSASSPRRSAGRCAHRQTPNLCTNHSQQQGVAPCRENRFARPVAGPNRQHHLGRSQRRACQQRGFAWHSGCLARRHGGSLRQHTCRRFTCLT